ncbi:MAG: hypothetical protein HAW59_01935 [Betaproteobacteria bacterium]|nr:hypothetical protein [Betaproteobacteria bacterium]
MAQPKNIGEKIMRWFVCRQRILMVMQRKCSAPSPEALAKMAVRHKKVRVVEKPYEKSRGGKGSVAGSNEYLLVCE